MIPPSHIHDNRDALYAKAALRVRQFFEIPPLAWPFVLTVGNWWRIEVGEGSEADVVAAVHAELDALYLAWPVEKCRPDVRVKPDKTAKAEAQRLALRDLVLKAKALVGGEEVTPEGKAWLREVDGVVRTRV